MGLQYITDSILLTCCENIAVDSRAVPDRGNPKDLTASSFQMEQCGGERPEPLPSQEALRESGELAFPVLDEVALGHEVVELLSLL